jgi:hypothetical protein
LFAQTVRLLPSSVSTLLPQTLLTSRPPPFPLLHVLFPHFHSLADARTDEELLPIFAIDTDGSKARSHSVMGKRNWAQVDYLPDGNLRFDIRVEIVQGGGDTKRSVASLVPLLSL